MPFIPHTEEEVREMLQTIGVSDIEDLFDEIPADLRCEPVDAVPSAMSEMEIARLMESRAGAVTSSNIAAPSPTLMTLPPISRS